MKDTQNTEKLNSNVLKITVVFLDQVNVHEHTVKMVPYCVFAYMYSLLIKKYICDRQNISIELPCAFHQEIF